MTAPCLHPRCPHPACDGYLCAGHAARRRRTPVRVTRVPSPVVAQAYARAWAEHDLTAEPDARTALRDRLRAALADADRVAAEHLRSPSDETAERVARVRARVVGALVAVGEVAL